jgi:alpha-tubulin suppressor-like RCC1 family protein
VPRLVVALAGKRVVGVSAGGEHSLLWTETGELYSFGEGTDGRLGHGGQYQNEHVPRLVATLAHKRVVGASAGHSHSVAWTEAGELYTFGYGGFGGLGHGSSASEYSPRLVQALAGSKVVAASAGTYHTAVVTEAGDLYTFGYGSQGQLGLGGTEHENLPKLVEALAGMKVVEVSAGNVHTAVVTAEGDMYTFGGGGRGRLGHGGEEDELVPRRVAALAGKRVVGVSADGWHTVAFTDEGQLYSFGKGGHGRLGHGGNANELVPRLVEAFAGQKVLGAAAGDFHTIVYTEGGEISTFGNGEHGRLGRTGAAGVAGAVQIAT